jgi:replication factor C subunit 1
VIGDMLDRSIRKEQEWGLMPSFGFMTCVYAPEKMSESIGFPAFPAWLGKFSSERKMKRLAKEFKDTILP